MRNQFSFTKRALFGIGAIALVNGTNVSSGAPVVPGLHAEHPLSESQKGSLLIEELRCASCHDDVSPSKAPSAPDLNGVASRLNADFVKNFIANPHSHDPGTAMPDVLGGRSEKERDELAAALTAYLFSLNDGSEAPAAISEEALKETEAGKTLFNQTGCVACHTPRDEKGKLEALPGDIQLDHVGKKYTSAGLAAFLHEPLKVRPAGRMPDMHLSRREAELISAFMLGSSEKATASEKPDAKLVAAGKQAFTEMRCVSCHQVDDATAPTLTPARAKPDQGCLSENPGSAPDFQLSAEQRKAIRAALSEKPTEPKPAEVIQHRLTQLNCISCHSRDEYGGVPELRDPYFHSTEEALGNESRIPPTLTLTGAKLRPEWMNKVFYEGEVVRPYMTTRMPRFGKEAMDGLTELLQETDKLEPFEFPEVDKQSEPMLRNGGHLLAGDTGLNCIACHNYNGIDSPGMKGLDLMTSYQRLQPAWFNQFMRDPGKFRQGIIMPSFWPDGKAIQTEILDGNTEDQIRALWHTFSLGRSARDPSGLRVENPELVVADKTLTYRGRSNVAGYRGIAVGFPGGLSYAFDANNGALSAIWQGRFVTVGWRGQGSGNFNPIGRHIQLSQDVAFLTELPENWPPHPVREGKAPNPDPRYPRQHGYAFKGYSIGENGIPTFRYQAGDVSISDVSTPKNENSSEVLTRTLTFETTDPTKLYFKALESAALRKTSRMSWSDGKINLVVDHGPYGIPGFIIRESGDSQKELIIYFDLPAGKTTQTIEYAISK